MLRKVKKSGGDPECMLTLEVPNNWGVNIVLTEVRNLVAKGNKAMT